MMSCSTHGRAHTLEHFLSVHAIKLWTCSRSVVVVCSAVFELFEDINRVGCWVFGKMRREEVGGVF